MNPRNYILIITLLIFFSCKTTNEITYTNLASRYDPDTDLKIEGYRIFHENDSITRVFLNYRTDALMYVQPPGKEYFRSNYAFSYQLFGSYESNKVLDENTYELSDSLFFTNPVVLNLDFPVKAEFPGDYVLEIRFTDLNADNSILYPALIQKKDRNSAQFFLPLNEADDVLLDDWISWKDRFEIKCSNPDINSLYVSYYSRDFPIAAPPFSQARPPVYKYNPEKVFTVKVEDGISESMQYGNEGFFHFQADSISLKGLTLYRFHDHYPDVRKPEQLAPPLRYLTSNKEFEKLMNATDVKQAVDSFWIQVAGSEGRAKELIEKYYGRVVHANTFFTSHKEGWKTDRGMIYVIFGKPKTVYRRSDIETWIYGEQGNRVYLTFDFIRAINPFSDNDYELQRNPDYKAQWYNAILFWRQ